MPAQTLGARPAARKRKIAVRKISDEDLRWALKSGLQDFGAMRGDLVFVGLLYPVIGILAAAMTTDGSLLPFFFPVAAGVGLLGPVAAVGFYELARRREAGQTSNWSHFFDVRKRSTVDDMGVVAGMPLAIFAAWLLAAGAIYVALFGLNVPDQIMDFVRMVFTTPRGWALIGVGAVVGAIFGWVVLAISVVSLPLLVDRNVTTAEAVSASWRAANLNKGEMIRWGLIVTVLLVLGSIPLFIGLAFVLPWLGYSTWHLYTRLVDRDKLPGRRRK